MQTFLISAGIVAVIALSIFYVVYVIGLARVFARLGQPRWKALVPIYNYYILVETLRLPKRWMAGSLVPYAGMVYAVAIAARLGKVFNRGLTFSSTWLTVGGVVGMHVIARDRRPLNLAALEEKPKIIKYRRRTHRNPKSPAA